MADMHEPFSAEPNASFDSSPLEAAATSVKPRCCAFGSSLKGALFALLVVAAVRLPADWSYWKKVATTGEFGSIFDGPHQCPLKNALSSCCGSSSGSDCQSSCSSGSMSSCSESGSCSSEGSCASESAVAILPKNPADILPMTELTPAEPVSGDVKKESEATPEDKPAADAVSEETVSGEKVSQANGSDNAAAD